MKEKKKKKEKIDLEVECSTLPDSELKRIFKKYEKKQKKVAGIPVWILIPALVVCGFNGYLAGFGAAGLAGGNHIKIGFSIYEFINFIWFAGCGALMASQNEKNFYVVPFIMLLDLLLMGVDVVTVLMLIYVIVGCAYLKKVVHTLNFMRGLPTFPFDERRQEIQFEAMTRKQMTKYLEQIQDNGVKTVGYEELFESSNPEKIVEEMKNPTINKEDKLQIHEKTQKAKDRQTAYLNKTAQMHKNDIYEGNNSLQENAEKNKKVENRQNSYLEKTSQMHKDDISEDDGYFQQRVEYDDFTEAEIQRIRKKYSNLSDL